MSLPTIEPIPDENENLPPARRRRQRRMVALPETGDQGEFLRELAHRSVPSFDFFLFSLLSGIILGLALLFDSPALVVLGVLLAPFMSPLIGLALGTVTGTPRFLFMSLGSLLIGSLIVFMCGMAAGAAVYLMPAASYSQAVYYGQFHLAFFLVLALGAALTSHLTVRTRRQRPNVTSVAVAYGLYLPAAVTGFALITGLSDLWQSALGLFFVHLLWAAAISTMALWFSGLRTLPKTGYLLGTAYTLAAAAVLAAIYLSGGINLNLGIPIAALLTPPAEVAGTGTENSQATAPTGAYTSISSEASSPTVSSGTPIPSIAVTPSPTLAANAPIGAPSPTASSGTPTPSIAVIPSTTSSPTQPASTSTLSPTRTLIPTNTVTLTITPAPTPIWARISAEVGDGAIIREEPSFDAAVIQALLNGTLVEVLPDQEVASGRVSWVRVRTLDGKEGWIVQTLLRTATPAAGG